ncbi:hypothetical protein KAFR_0D00330 [Kazachstania africana CBS 2517]|uniref:Autophagy-related protein n=1 Tax=Kazachstania africana (strain ATCC 22294 / BCRC 22015 / CBS 2517 / CECT 1963 / NBRC 1671 / NRRL Y-8276) TaxID=1071382 RepID=H2ATI0_KAZAF|nr:hypothetical protein KAFR_0D00330 [Kazachstania africana CBS 2517]CCF57680.1 hypothetical protein KAFR_0D00330 [Kazachstania africana CBS 2517]
MNEDDPLQITKKNIKGWYFYSFSSEPFIVSAVSTYIPLLLEQFARINGVKLNDHSQPCIIAPATHSTDKCVVPLFNGSLFVDTSSFALYTFSISVLFQTVMVITVSGIVDILNSIRFKGLTLVTFSILGALSTIYISQLSFDQIYTLPLLCIIANSCYGVINVVGNSLLPIFISDLTKYGNGGEEEDENSSLISDTNEKLTNIISGRGASIGYSSALIVQLISMALVGKSKSRENIQIAVLFVGIWWIIWQLPMLWLLRDINENPQTIPHSIPISSLKYGWWSLYESFKNAKLLKDVMIFLLGWFIISDSLTTINSTAILFSRTELSMSAVNLIAISIITMIMAMIGAFIIPNYLAKKFNWLPHRTLVYIICWSSFIPFYGMLGFFFQSIGLKHKFEMYALAVWYGLSLGGLAAVSRTVFSLIIPKGKESTFFSMFSITDKGSSIVGPSLVGLITDKTHNIRYSFFLLFGLLVVSLPIFSSLDVKRGKREAEELSKI